MKIDYLVVIIGLLNISFYGGIIFIFVKFIINRTKPNFKNIEAKLDRIIELLEQNYRHKGVVTEKRGFYTLRHILPEHRYIQKNL